MAAGRLIDLRSGSARAAVLPEVGGGLAGLWADGLPVLRPWNGRAEDGPFALGLNLLVPFSNRISGGFEFGGLRHELAPNLSGEPFPIHGDAFQRQWQSAEVADDRVRLALDHGAFGPFRYRATVDYHLTPSHMRIDLSLTSTAEVPLPYGLGFHPWFPRSGATRIDFRAWGAWPEDTRHLPNTRAPVPLLAGGLGASRSSLPQGWINRGFADWSGCASIEQDEGAVDVRLRSGGLATAILYSPSADADFFCFEPVSHPVDAHNLPGRPGLETLGPGERMSADLTIDWSVPASG